jgi:hypothetical protein
LGEGRSITYRVCVYRRTAGRAFRIRMYFLPFVLRFVDVAVGGITVRLVVRVHSRQVGVDACILQVCRRPCFRVHFTTVCPSHLLGRGVKVRLVVGVRRHKGRVLRQVGLDAADRRVWRKIELKALGVVQLRHQQHVGQRDLHRMMAVNGPRGKPHMWGGQLSA